MEADPRIGLALEGRYRLVEPLGEGGMGVVYKAERIGIGRLVAVKFLQEGAVSMRHLVKRFEREVAAMSRLSHPNLTAVIDSGVHDGVPYLVMDYQKGKSLGDLLDRGALTPRRAVGIARQILSGLKHAHATGVLHRDLKPDNVMLLEGVEGDFVKILDFGLAKIAIGDEESSLVTATGFALGTPGYMSPEQARGGKADERSDVYSVGVMMYQMVVGRKPFVAESPLAVLRMHMDDAPEPPRKAAPSAGVSVELEQVILRALEKEPAKRWKSAEELIAALDATPEAPKGDEVPFGEASLQERKEDVGRAETIEGPSGISAAELTGGATVAGRSRPGKALRRPVGGGWRRVVVFALIAGAAVGATRVFPKEMERARRWAGMQVERAWNAVAAEGAPATEKTIGPGVKTVAAKPGAPVAAKPVAPVPVPVPVKPPVAPVPVAPPPVAPSPPVAPVVTSPAVQPDAAPLVATAPKVEPATGEPDDPAFVDDGRDEPPPPHDTPGEQLEREAAAEQPVPPPSPVAKPRLAPVRKGPTANDGARLLTAGKVDQAILALYAARRDSPRDADVPLLLGHAYFRKNWRNDGLREYATAARLRPGLARNATVIRNTLNSLDNDRAYPQARAFVRRSIGAAALPGLRVLARSKNAKTQRRAVALIGDVRGRR